MNLGEHGLNIVGRIGSHEVRLPAQKVDRGVRQDSEFIENWHKVSGRTGFSEREALGTMDEWMRIIGEPTSFRKTPQSGYALVTYKDRQSNEITDAPIIWAA